MAYNRENLLRKIVKIQQIVLDFKKQDVPQTVIYRKYIAEQFNISYSCFNNYLAVNAKYELREIERKNEEQDNQLTLFEV